MDRGGAELRTLDLMPQTALSGYEFHFATLAPGPGALDAEIGRLNGQVHSCPLGVTFPLRFRALLHEGRFDIVHSHVHHFSGYILRLARKEGVPGRVAHYRSTGDGHPTTIRRRAQRAITRRWLERHATAIVAVSEGAMRHAWRDDWREDARCTVIYDGLDLQEFSHFDDRISVRRELDIGADEALIVHVGTMSSFKNQERLVHIFDEFHRRRSTCRLVLVGRDGDGTKQRVEHLIHAMQLTDHVMILGERNDVPGLLKAADLMIFPSIREGLPGAILEACAAGTPVVASDLPGVKEIAAICPSVACLPLTAGDHQWVTAAEDLLDSPPPTIDLAGGPFDASTAAGRLRTVYEQRAF
jgi:glycosyltransferase involved in cell wall biosynthesis